MKIGILQTGRTPEQMRDKHGDYDDLFKRLLAGRGFELVTYPVLEGVFPKDVYAAEGWLITGSKFGVYEDHEWIPPLEDFLRQAYSSGVPIIGVCFGHQIFAQALGGTVKKFSGGWSVEAVDYQMSDPPGKETVMAWHQDQVVELPEDAEVIGQSDFCQYAMLAYGDRALTVQPHPEFNADFLADLLAARRNILPTEVAERAAASVDSSLSSAQIADRFESFFKMDRTERSTQQG